ncbi:MAG: HAMP domain-containing protein, partial [Deltaproteobacteria bacterium]|nr:HAMP domain-containing protein [Deltaproteobacteria bacterium]
LGALELVVSLAETDHEIRSAERGIFVFAVVFFLVEAVIIFFFVHRFFNRPIRKLINGTRHIAEGKYDCNIDIGQEYELGQLAAAINLMGLEIGKKQKELNEQRDEYQALFDRAPCMITVQDREFRLLRFNRAFAEKFNPVPGSFCYSAYKGRDSKCENCPVEKTFQDGKSHYG